MEILLGGLSDCEEFVGIDQGTKNDTLSKALIHKHIKNYKGTPKGVFGTRK